MTSGALFLSLLLLSNAGQEARARDMNEACTKSITFLEARGEGVKGIAAVKTVIANRARMDGEPSCKIVKRRGQFSSYKRGMSLSKVKIDKNFLTAWKRSEKIRPLGPEYTHFYRQGSRPTWARQMVCDRQIKNHVFCKLKQLGRK